MKLLKGIGTALSLAVLCLLVAPKAKADDWNHKTKVTFSEPFEVPGVGQHILPAGTYVFKLMDSPVDRHIVQIFNEDETHVFATILAISNFRLKTTDKTVITFRERPEGEPAALKAWFYPGREYGDQFVYERSRALQLATESNEAVLSTPVVPASGTAEDLNTVPVQAVSPTGDTVDTSTVVDTPPVVAATPVEQAAAAAPEPAVAAALPKTASNLPFVGLAGLLMLGGGFVLLGLSKLRA